MESKPSASRSAYGAWLAYVMNERRADPKKLARKSGVAAEHIEALLRGDIDPDDKDENVFKIADALLVNTPRKQMELVLQALRVHIDLRNWASSCDGGCCK
jgi:hypothetical protein